MLFEGLSQDLEGSWVRDPSRPFLHHCLDFITGWPFVMAESAAIAIPQKTRTLTKQWKIHHLKTYLLLEKVDFHCYLSLPEGKLDSSTQGLTLKPFSRSPWESKCFAIGFWTENALYTPLKKTNQPFAMKNTTMNEDVLLLDMVIFFGVMWATNKKNLVLSIILVVY